MGVRLVRMDPDAGPDVVMAIGDGNDRVPFALAGGDVEEAGNAACARILEHFVLALHEPFVIEVAMTIDQPHAASSSSSSRRGNKGVGCGIGFPPSPASIRVSSLSADSGMI